MSIYRSYLSGFRVNSAELNHYGDERSIITIEMDFDEFKRLFDFLEKFESEEQLRSRVPAVQKAYEKYETLIKLVKS